MMTARVITTIYGWDVASLVQGVVSLRARASMAVYSSDAPCGRHGDGATTPPLLDFSSRTMYNRAHTTGHVTASPFKATNVSFVRLSMSSCSRDWTVICPTALSFTVIHMLPMYFRSIRHKPQLSRQKWLLQTHNIGILIWMGMWCINRFEEGLFLMALLTFCEMCFFRWWF